MPRSLKREGIVLRCLNHGCRNRPFYYIVAASRGSRHVRKYVEQIGSYDPLINVHGERLVSLKFEKVKKYIADGAKLTMPVKDILSWAGIVPPQARMYAQAPVRKQIWKLMDEEDEAKEKEWRESLIEKGFEPEELRIFRKGGGYPSPLTKENLAARRLRAELDAADVDFAAVQPPADYWDGREPASRSMVHPRLGVIKRQGRRPQKPGYDMPDY